MARVSYTRAPNNVDLEVDLFGVVHEKVAAFVLYTAALATVNCLQIFFDAQVDKHQR